MGARSTGQYHLDVVDVRAERPAAMIFLPYVRGDAAAERFVCLPTTAISETAPLIATEVRQLVGASSARVIVELRLR